MSTHCKLDWCSQKAARYAVMHWHYSARMPSGKLARIGVWEDDVFIGAIIYGQGATTNIARPFGLKRAQVSELVRVALRSHITPVSRLIAISLKMIHRAYPGLEIIISFADTARGHHGGIYQAAGWYYLGASSNQEFVIHGKQTHMRTMGSRYPGRPSQSIAWIKENVDPNARRVNTPNKYKYAIGLTPQSTHLLAANAQPYPKRAASIAVMRSPSQAKEGGSTPTAALQTS